MNVAQIQAIEAFRLGQFRSSVVLFIFLVK